MCSVEHVYQGSVLPLFTSMVSPINPLLDAYQVPYTDKFRCWTGVMLIARFILFATANGFGDPDVNLVVINIALYFVSFKLSCGYQGRCIRY